MSQQEYLRKIAVKTVLGHKPAVPETVNESAYLFTILGSATGVKKYTSNFGEGFALTGDFAAMVMNKETGEVEGKTYRAPECYIPDTAMHGAVVGRVERGEQVTFAFHVSIKAVSRDVAPIGYMYALEPLADPEAHDPLAHLAKRVGVKALEKQPEKGSQSKAKK